MEQQFTEFATLAAPRLRRTAFLLCGDWHMAEDLAQTALAKVFVSWRGPRSFNSRAVPRICVKSGTS